LKIKDLLTEGIATEKHEHRKAKCELINKKPIIPEKNTAVKFERETFGYLFENKDKLGIKEVYKLTNMLLDGAVRLEDGRLILLEFKYVMNCYNSSRARLEVEGFMAEKLYTQFLPALSNPERALVIFENFSGDWNRRTKDHKNLNGWTLFYEEENLLRKELKVIPIDIAQLTGKELINPLIH
jgi:hypothetical protein